MSGFVTLTDSSGNLISNAVPLLVQLAGPSGPSISNFWGNQDATSGTSAASLPSWSQNSLFNGVSWDRQRGNVDTGALLTLAAQGLGTVNGADQTNYNGRGLKLIIDVTAISGTSPTVTVTIQGKDPTSGKYFTILASAALNAVATTVLTVYPGQTAAANVAANDILPRTFRVIAVVGGTGPSVTATVAASLIV